MRFTWTHEQLAFRERVRRAIDDNLPADFTRSAATAVGSAEVSQAALQFCQAMARQGLLVPHWPSEFGGSGADPWTQLIIAEEMWTRGEPRGPQYMNSNWIGPAIMQFGSTEQQRRYLPPMARGESFWCQGFSEADAGSDLRAIRTTAVRDGSAYVVTGMKLWTSYALGAQHCFLLVKTGCDIDASQSVTILLIDLPSNGLTVSPIDSVVGSHAFHSLRFEDVRVPVACRLGAENDGWHIMRSVLRFERVGNPRYKRSETVLNELADRWKLRGEADPGLQARFGQAWGLCQAARVLTYRVADHKARDEEPADALVEMARISAVAAERFVAQLACDLEGADGLETGAVADAQYRNSLAAGIAAGTYEMQLSAVASRFLRLPRS